MYAGIHDRVKISFLGNANHTHRNSTAGLRRKTAQTANRLRPLARLALMMARPPRVFIRTKKPWVRARRVFEGWYVRFMVCLSGSKVNRALSLFFTRPQRKYALVVRL